MSTWPDNGACNNIIASPAGARNARRQPLRIKAGLRDQYQNDPNAPEYGKTKS
jgi:hypothetical protein